MTTTTDSASTDSAVDYAEEWVERRRQHFSYREIGAAFGFSHERVRQVVLEADPSLKDMPNPREVKREERLAQVKKYLDEHGPTPRNILLAALKMTDTELRSVADDLPAHYVLPSIRLRKSGYTDEQMLGAMKEVWKRVEDSVATPDGLSHARYEELRDEDQPSASAIILRYGFWSTACEKADVPEAMSTSTREYTSQWSDQDIATALCKYMDDCTANGKRATYTGYEKFQHGKESLPSGPLVRRRLKRLGVEGWPGMLAHAIHICNK